MEKRAILPEFVSPERRIGQFQLAFRRYLRRLCASRLTPKPLILLDLICSTAESCTEIGAICIFCFSPLVPDLAKEAQDCQTGSQRPAGARIRVPPSTRGFTPGYFRRALRGEFDSAKGGAELLNRLRKRQSAAPVVSERCNLWMLRV